MKNVPSICDLDMETVVLILFIFSAVLQPFFISFFPLFLFFFARVGWTCFWLQRILSNWDTKAPERLVLFTLWFSHLVSTVHISIRNSIQF